MKPFTPCPNCGRNISKGGHFVPPSLGDEGFFACESFKTDESEEEYERNKLRMEKKNENGNVSERKENISTKV
jgi:hypothetical protein